MALMPEKTIRTGLPQIVHRSTPVKRIYIMLGIPSKRYERISAYLIYVKILEPFLTPNYHPFKPYQVPECTLLLPKETTLGLFTGKSFFHRPKKPVLFVELIWFTDLIFPSFLAPLIEALSPP